MQTNTALCSKQSNPSPTDCQGQSDTILLDYARKGGSFGDTQFTTIGSIADNLARQQLLTQLRDIFRQQKRLTQFNQTFDQWIRQQNQLFSIRRCKFHFYQWLTGRWCCAAATGLPTTAASIGSSCKRMAHCIGKQPAPIPFCPSNG